MCNPVCAHAHAHGHTASATLEKLAGEEMPVASCSPAGAAAPSGSPVPVPRSRGYSTRRPPSWADLGGVPHNGVIQLLCGSAPSP